MNTKIIIATIAGLAISPLAMSDNAPSYSFVEGGYTSYDTGSFEPSGFKLKGSLVLGEMFFITADYSDTSGTPSGFDIDIDLTSTGFGAGVKYDLSDSGSLYASYTKNTWEIGNGTSNSDIDFDTLRLGYRQNISESLELNASVTSTEPDGESESDSGYQFGLVYAFSDTVNISADYDTIDDLKITSVGVRVYF